MNSKAKISRVQLLAILLGALTVCAAALRTVALTLFLNTDTGYLPRGGISIPLHILEVLAVAFCVAMPFLIKRDTLKVEAAPLSIAALFGAGLCALTMVLCAAYFLLRSARVPAPTVVVLLAAIFLLGGAFYFVNQFRSKQEPATALPLGYAAILASALLLAALYFDLNTPMNAPHKISLQMALLATMVALLYELRVFTGEPRPRVQLAVCGYACFSCAVAGIPNTIAFFSDAYGTTAYLFADLTALALAVYFGAKCVSLCCPAKSDGEVTDQ